MPKIPEKIPKYLTYEEVDTLLNMPLKTAYDYRTHAMLELLYATGMRISELLTLKFSNIDFINDCVRVEGKGSKERIVPINDASKKALERVIGMIYTSNGINQPGNTVLAGHNYKNSLFFSKNKYLVEGNPIYIKDATGVEVKYIVTSKFTTNDTDTSFYQRDTGGKREITLSTCTNETGKRTIVWARETKN